MATSSRGLATAERRPAPLAAWTQPPPSRPPRSCSCAQPIFAPGTSQGRRCDGATLLAHKTQDLLDDRLHRHVDLEGFPIAACGPPRHIDHRLDPAWASLHYQHTVAEKHRLIDAVGDEKHGLGRCRAQPRQLLL